MGQTASPWRLAVAVCFARAGRPAKGEHPGQTSGPE